MCCESSLNSFHFVVFFLSRSGSPTQNINKAVLMTVVDCAAVFHSLYSDITDWWRLHTNSQDKHSHLQQTATSAIWLDNKVCPSSTFTGLFYLSSDQKVLHSPYQPLHIVFLMPNCLTKAAQGLVNHLVGKMPSDDDKRLSQFLVVNAKDNEFTTVWNSSDVRRCFYYLLSCCSLPCVMSKWQTACKTETT